MPLSEEEKQALKEKYKQQRRAMWDGKSARHGAREAASKEPLDLEAETPARRETRDDEHQVNTTPAKTPASVPPPTETVTNVKVQKSPHADNAHEAFRRMREAASERTSQSQQNSGVEGQRTAVDNADAPRSQPVEPVASEDNPSVPDETLLIEKIREQREETWEGQSSIRSSRRKQRRKLSKGENKFWSESEDSEEPNMLTWKLAVGVVGTIIVLIGIGILLGFWFAS